MSEIPGLPADVFFGGVDKSLPDWRAEQPDIDDPEQADEPDDNSAILASLYGYDPSWFDEGLATESIADVFLAVGKAVHKFWSVGLSVFFDMRPIVDAIENDADEDDVAELIKSILFPPPMKEEAQAIIEGSGIAHRWAAKLRQEGYSFPAISNQVSTGLSQGKNIQQIAKDVRPLVDNVYYRATRIARTESLRVVQELNRKSQERTDDLIVGQRLHGTMDDRIRPEHRANVGPDGHRDFRPDKPPGPPLQSKQAFEVDKWGCPKTPYGTNCRCYSEPLLRGIDE